MTTEHPHGYLFHHFHDDRHPQGQGSISSKKFEEIVEFVGRGDILDADEWFDRVVSGTLAPHHRCITFDDGLRCQYDVALPVLDRLGIKAFWFVYTSPFRNEPDHLELYRNFRTTCFDAVDDFYAAFYRQLEVRGQAAAAEAALRETDIESYLAHAPFYTTEDRKFRFVRDQFLGQPDYQTVMSEMMSASGFDAAEAARSLWMNEAEIASLLDHGHMIGLHSHTHPTNLAGLDANEQKREFTLNKEILEQIGGRQIQIMSHPCNSYNDDTLNLLGDLGIKLGFRADFAGVARSTLECPRVNHAIILNRMAQQ